VFCNKITFTRGDTGIGFSPIIGTVRTLLTESQPALNEGNVGPYRHQRNQNIRIERPLSFDEIRKNAFTSLLQYGPISWKNVALKSKQNKSQFDEETTSLSNRNRVTINNQPETDNSGNIQTEWQQYEVNMTSNNKQYAMFLNDQYVPIVDLILSQNVPTPLYLRSSFQTRLNPEEVNLSSGARRIMLEENAGGQSELSEGFSFEFLRKLFGAKLVKTEMAIRYWWNSWKKTDYSVKMSGNVIGVSVTRAMKYKGIFTRVDAEKLLRKKLFGINESTLGVLEQDEWQRQILHIWATDEYIERILYEVFLRLLFTEPDLVRNTLVMVTVTSSWWIFYQDKYIKSKDKAMKKKVIREEMTKMETTPLAAAVT